MSIDKHEEELEPVVVEVLLDPQIRQFCAPHLHPWMFQRTVFKYLIETIISPDFVNRPVDLKILRLYMQSNYRDLYADDWQVVENLFKGYAAIQSPDVESVTQIVKNFIKSRIYLKGFNLYAKGDVKSAESCFLDAQSFTILPDPFINPLQEGIIEHLIQKDMPHGGLVIKSSLGIVNSSLLHKGYKNGDLIMVVMSPKCGKSTFMVQEAAAAADQGFKIVHMFFGDFTEYDGLCKFMSCVTGDPISNVVNAPKLYQKRCESWLENWRVAAFPALSLDTSEIISYARNYRKKFQFDMMVIDYDSNVKPPGDTAMYETGGVMYSAFKGFGQQEGVITIIGSQPKIGFWDDEVLSHTSAAESSRKQHVVDVMITAGRNPAYKKIGTFHLPLVRRGISSEITRVRFDDSNSRITEITQEEYDNLLRAHKDRRTEAGDFRLQGVSFG
jgi:hypothetical protein